MVRREGTAHAEAEDALLDGDERERLLAEVVVAYRLNTEVFDDLDRTLTAADA